MKRDKESARRSMTASPLSMSCSQPSWRAPSQAFSRRLAEMERMGASELLISWPRTRTRRCQAWRSSSRSARRRSASTTSTCGFPPSRKLVRLSSNFPAPPGSVSSRVLGAEQLLRRAVGEDRLSAFLESQHRDVDLLHHAAEERSRLQGSETLFPEH